MVAGLCESVSVSVKKMDWEYMGINKRGFLIERVRGGQFMVVFKGLRPSGFLRRH